MVPGRLESVASRWNTFSSPCKEHFKATWRISLIGEYKRFKRENVNILISNGTIHVHKIQYTTKLEYIFCN